MPKKQSGEALIPAKPARHAATGANLSRRQLMTMGAGVVAASALPALPAVGVVAFDPPLDLASFVGPRPDFEGLSPQFRGWFPRVTGGWRTYLWKVEPEDDSATIDPIWVVQWERRVLEPRIEYLTRMVPETDRDHEALAYTQRLIHALLADFPDVAWRPDLLESMRLCRERYNPVSFNRAANLVVHRTTRRS